MIVLVGMCAFACTLLGGLAALKFKDKLHLVLGFSAGAVVGVAFFDLLPEARELGGKFYSTATIAAVVALGFLAYMILDRLLWFHLHHEEDEETMEKPMPSRGILGAGSLSIHSFLDGVAIGVAFKVATGTGLVVTVAVLAHDFSDGINTVSFMLKHTKNAKSAFQWLMVDAAAPVLGVASTLFFALPESMVGLVLAVFGGFFLYIGASELVPESHHAHPKLLTTVLTVVGAAMLYLIIRIANV
jgi:ZIP family zinc transporter